MVSGFLWFDLTHTDHFLYKGVIFCYLMNLTLYHIQTAVSDIGHISIMSHDRADYHSRTHSPQIFITSGTIQNLRICSLNGMTNHFDWVEIRVSSNLVH